MLLDLMHVHQAHAHQAPMLLDLMCNKHMGNKHQCQTLPLNQHTLAPFSTATQEYVAYKVHLS